MAPLAIEAVAEYWDEILPYLQPRDIAYIAASLQHLDLASPADVERAAADIALILVTRLPSGHHVRELISAQPRFAPGSHASAHDLVALSRLIGQIRARPELRVDDPEQPEQVGGEEQPGAVPGGAPGAGSDAQQEPAAAGQPAAAEEAEAWLLAEPALTEDQVRTRGGDPGRDDLIRLSTRAGQILLPSFQFGPSGEPVPVVATINRLLAASDDPWGVADWWLGENAWLDGIPADVLGQVDDALLVRAAEAEFLGD